MLLLTTLFILFTNTTLNRLGFGMLTVRVGTAIFHWTLIYSCSTGTPSSQRDLYKYYLVREFNGEKS